MATFIDRSVVRASEIDTYQAAKAREEQDIRRFRGEIDLVGAEMLCRAGERAVRALRRLPAHLRPQVAGLPYLGALNEAQALEGCIIGSAYGQRGDGVPDDAAYLVEFSHQDADGHDIYTAWGYLPESAARRALIERLGVVVGHAAVYKADSAEGLDCADLRAAIASGDLARSVRLGRALAGGEGEENYLEGLAKDAGVQWRLF